MIDRQLLRAKAKSEFKKLKKESSKNKNISFGSFFSFYKARERMKAVSGQIKEFSEIVSDSEATLLDSMFSDASINQPENEIIEINSL